MTTVTFPPSEALDRIVSHALDNSLAVLFVHDQGLYLMVKTLRTADGSGALCAYAAGCDPDADEDWYDTARDLVGGDDFVEQFEAREIAPMIADSGGLALEVSESHISMRRAA